MKIHKEYTGKEFNELTKRKIFVNLTNEKDIHNEYKSEEIYFILLEDMYKWLNYGQGKMTKIRKVTLPDDARIYVDKLVEKRKFKADKLILGEEILIKECFYHENINKLICLNESSIDFDNQYDYVCENVYKFLRWYEGCNVYDFINEIKNNKIENIFNCLKNNPEWIRYIRNPNEEICIFVVNINGLLLKYIKNQTKDICITAVQNDSYAIKYVKEEFKETCKDIKENALNCREMICNKLRFIEKNYDLEEFKNYINNKKINIKELNYFSINYSTEMYINRIE